MKASAVIRVKFSSRKHLELVLNALKPEVKKPATMRSRTRIEKDNGFLVLRVEARNTVALRTTLNTYLRWINSVMQVLEVLRKC